MKTVNMMKALNRCHLKALYDEMGCEQTKLCWVFHGNVVIHLFELGDGILLFLHHSAKLYDTMHDFQGVTKCAFLAEFFSTLETLNVALQVKIIAVFNAQDKMKATYLKLNYSMTLSIAHNSTVF